MEALEAEQNHVDKRAGVVERKLRNLLETGTCINIHGNMYRQLSNMILDQEMVDCSLCITGEPLQEHKIEGGS